MCRIHRKITGCSRYQRNCCDMIDYLYAAPGIILFFSHGTDFSMQWGVPLRLRPGTNPARTQKSEINSMIGSIEKYLQEHLPDGKIVMQETKIPHVKLLQAGRDSRKAAAVARLIYITAGARGFTRKKTTKGFVYYAGNKRLTDKKHLQRIRSLAIPPSWRDVWICASANGHIQATGIDLRNRKQYRYHPQWNRLRNETKFHRLFEFGKLLPRLRRKVKRDMRSKKLVQEKVLATAIDLMEKTYIRLGNESYEKENGSYGLATLKDRHVSVQHDKLIVSFNGKKGVKHTISLKNKKLARIIKQCRDIPGKPLFQYYDEQNNRKAIDSTMLNNYIKEATAPDFSAKDIRTWAGSVLAIEYMLQAGTYENAGTQPAAAMLDWVSRKLGNSRNVCKKYYVHPSLIGLCEQKQQLADLKLHTPVMRGLTSGEQLLMCILKAK